MAENSINNRLKIISNLQDEINRAKVAYDESLEDDDTYADIQKEVEQNKEYIKERKLKVLTKPEFKEMNEQIKDLRRDLAENKEALSQELVEHYRQTGEMEIVDEEGNRKRIKFSARLVKI